MAAGKQKEIPLYEEEIRLAKRDLLDFVLSEIVKVENYWRHRYRVIVGMGLGISFDSGTDIGETEDGLVVAWNLRVFIPEELWMKFAKLRKMRRMKLPKPHPVVRQRYRQMEETVREIEEELSETIEEYESGGESGQGDQDSGAGRSGGEDRQDMRGA